jgi:hypothetical protein
MTAEELGNLLDEPLRHELIKGELLTMPLPKAEHTRVAANLIIILGQYAKANRLGRVYAEGGYKIESHPDTVLGPAPQRGTVEVISSTGERRILHETDELVDDTVPGFRVKVSEIFA